MRMMARTAGVGLGGLLCAALGACGADEGGDTRNVVPPDPDVRVGSRSLLRSSRRASALRLVTSDWVFGWS